MDTAVCRQRRIAVDTDFLPVPWPLAICRQLSASGNQRIKNPKSGSKPGHGLIQQSLSSRLTSNLTKASDRIHYQFLLNRLNVGFCFAFSFFQIVFTIIKLPSIQREKQNSCSTNCSSDSLFYFYTCGCLHFYPCIGDCILSRFFFVFLLLLLERQLLSYCTWQRGWLKY